MNYIISLLTGLLVGILYAALKVRSPAPPIIALLGLLGMVIGEQAILTIRAWTSPASTVAATSADHSPSNESDTQSGANASKSHPAFLLRSKD